MHEEAPRGVCRPGRTVPQQAMRASHHSDAARTGRTPRARRRLVGAAAAVACLIAAAPASALAAGPKVSTGGATHILLTSALLTGSVNPGGVETSYYFRYGATPAYGLQTAPASAGPGTTVV